MDATIVAEPMAMGVATAPVVRVVTTINVDDLVIMLESLFDAASILPSLLSLGNTSRSAVAPDYTFSRGGVSTWAMA